MNIQNENISDYFFLPKNKLCLIYNTQHIHSFVIQTFKVLLMKLLITQWQSYFIQSIRKLFQIQTKRLTSV